MGRAIVMLLGLIFVIPVHARLGEIDAQISARFKTTPLTQPRPDQHHSYSYVNYSVKVQFMDGKSVYERYSTKSLKPKIGEAELNGTP